MKTNPKNKAKSLPRLKKKMRKPRYNLEKQEALVSAIWDFARAQQYRPHDCTSHPMPSGGEGDIRPRVKVSVNMRGVTEAVNRILEIFEYEEIEIQ